MKNTLANRLLPALAALIALMLYARVTGYNYFWDDITIFRQHISPMLGALDLSQIAQPFLENINYFRPLAIFSFWLDAVLVGNHPGFSHAVNLVLFLVNILLVFSVCRRLAETLGSPRAVPRAFCAALIYAIHPVMVESTVWISGRFDVLATTFILGATRVYLSHRPGHWRVIGFGLLAFFAMLSKETGVMLLPGVFCLGLAIEAARQETPLSWANFRQYLAGNEKILNICLGVVALYAVLRFIFIPALPEGAATKHGAVFLIVESVKFYFHQALFPFATMFPVHPTASVLSPWTPVDILGNCATLMALIAVVFCALRRQSAAAWVFLAGMCYLILVLHIIPIPIGGNLGHERFLTTPLAFWAIAAALTRWEMIFSAAPMQRLAAAMNVFSPRMIAQTAAVTWFAMIAWTTHTTIPIWQNGLTLWSWAWQQFPEDKISRYNYLNAMLSADSETAQKAADYLLRETGFLYAPEAILCANILLNDRNIKALEYLDMVKQQAGDALTIHTKSNAESQRANLTLEESGIIANYYDLSARAHFSFKKDAIAAQQLNETAFWYTQRKQKLSPKEILTYRLRKMSYLYGMGLFGPANKMRDEMSASYGIKKEGIHEVMTVFLKDYCDLKTDGSSGEAMSLICEQTNRIFLESSGNDA